jgi:hypothetical protein
MFSNRTGEEKIYGLNGGREEESQNLTKKEMRGTSMNFKASSFLMLWAFGSRCKWFAMHSLTTCRRKGKKKGGGGRGGGGEAQTK